MNPFVPVTYDSNPTRTSRPQNDSGASSPWLRGSPISWHICQFSILDAQKSKKSSKTAYRSSGEIGKDEYFSAEFGDADNTWQGSDVVKLDTIGSGKGKEFWDGEERGVLWGAAATGIERGPSGGRRGELG